ncbi:MAG: Uma2 family endonuclease [Leptolyngbya sp.]|nr:Uma2 family endonuclease [Leptolyngbya sp.]
MSPRPLSSPSVSLPTNPYIVPADVPLPPRESWPTMYDLPSEDPEEPGLPDEFHDFQPQLLSATFRLADVAEDRLFTAADLNLYYDISHPRWYKRPDWFAVVDVPRFCSNGDLRLSYVTWHEQVNPYLVVELLSPGTADEDLGLTQATQPNAPPPKWQVYEQILRIPYYVVFDRYTGNLQAFRLTEAGYVPIAILDGRFTLPELGIGLGLWRGKFQGSVRDWLRFFDASGEWILTPVEREREQAHQERLRAEREQLRAERERLRAEEARQRADQERLRAESAEQQANQERLRAEEAGQRAEEERQRAESAEQQADQERLRAERLAELLRSQGIDPDSLA